MPHIAHVALWTRDLEGLAAFYAEVLDARVGERYEHPAHGFASRFLAFDGGPTLELMETRQLTLETAPPGAQRLGLTHLAFSLGSPEAVDALTARLAAMGRPVLDRPRTTGDGYYESTVLDPDGNRLELTV
ncbi:VOC family protein [Mesoterricola sediminis]|uniref:Lactoylglutathione lyase n=1 Tax=Mesoterricola sediminis TaxID=2927980 RepID=A0AA48GVI4_9BACT|nr:VOC family protein [Mesoterricola sediminis]BDU78579.1 lactoylglutathione lyase [Mesoterricola sediminis]